MIRKGEYPTQPLPKPKNSAQDFLLRRSVEDIVVCFYSNTSFRIAVEKESSLFILSERFRVAHCNNFKSWLYDYELRNHMQGKFTDPKKILAIALRSKDKENVEYWKKCFPNLDIAKFGTVAEKEK